MPIRNTLLALAVSSSLGGCVNNTSGAKLRGTLDIDVSITHTTSAVQGIMGIDKLTSTSQPLGQYELCKDKGNGYQLMCKEGYDSISIGNYQQLFPIIKKVFNIGKRIISPDEDINIYGVQEKWSYPLVQEETYRGDCEDFVIFWMQKLRDAGVSDFALRPIVVKQEDGGGHLILGIITERGTFVLDNLQKEVVFIKSLSDIQKQLGYTFIKISGNQSSSIWMQEKKTNS